MAFWDYPDADIIAFNLVEKIPNPVIFIKKRPKKGLDFIIFLTYGTARIAVRLSKVRENGISFNLCFGGGTEHCHGER